MTKHTHTIYVASCVQDGGIFRYHMNEAGELTSVDCLPMEWPMYLAIDKNRLYAVLRGASGTESYVQSMEILPGGALSQPSEPISTRGTVACHLCLLDGAIYCANYSSGSLIRLPDRLVAHHGSSVNPRRQAEAHVHQVMPTPDGKYVCAADLGMDKLMLYDRELNLVSETIMPAGAGPRHVAFAPNGRYAYCVNEMGNTVTPLAYADGRLTIIGESVSTLPADCSLSNTGAAIRVSEDGKMLYASNRGHDSIACYALDAAGLPHIAHIDSCGGRGPRDFILVEAGGKRFAIVTNEPGNSVRVLEEGADGLRLLPQEISLKQPLCALAVAE